MSCEQRCVHNHAEATSHQGHLGNRKSEAWLKVAHVMGKECVAARVLQSTCAHADYVQLL